MKLQLFNKSLLLCHCCQTWWRLFRLQSRDNNSNCRVLVKHRSTTTTTIFLECLVELTSVKPRGQLMGDCVSSRRTLWRPWPRSLSWSVSTRTLRSATTPTSPSSVPLSKKNVRRTSRRTVRSHSDRRLSGTQSGSVTDPRSRSAMDKARSNVELFLKQIVQRRWAKKNKKIEKVFYDKKFSVSWESEQLW